jgi:hypothetical protein
VVILCRESEGFWDPLSLLYSGYPMLISSMLKLLVREADNSLPPSAGVKNCWNCISSALHFMTFIHSFILQSVLRQVRSLFILQSVLRQVRGLFILQSVLRQVRSLFQSEFSTGCDLVLPLSISSIFSFP